MITSTKAPLPRLVLLLVAVSCGAQSFPGTPAPPPAPQALQPLTLTQTPGQDTFSGSAMIDKPVPGAVSLSILDAINRGLQHNLGLLLSQQQNVEARAQYRRALSALLPNVTGSVSDSLN